MNIQSAALTALLALGTSALAGDSVTGFSHDNKSELFGYYLPPDGTKTGHYLLHDFAIGPLDDIKKWESGKDRMANYAPVMFQFTDVSSKLVKNEESGEMEHSEEVRVMPTAYRIKGNTDGVHRSQQGTRHGRLHRHVRPQTRSRRSIRKRAPTSPKRSRRAMS